MLSSSDTEVSHRHAAFFDLSDSIRMGFDSPLWSTAGTLSQTPDEPNARGGGGSMDFRKRQQRPRGYNDPGHAHELTFSCYRRYRFLSRESTCEWLAEAIDAARRELQYDLWAFVFMPDHVHLIVYPRQRVSNTS